MLTKGNPADVLSAGRRIRHRRNVVGKEFYNGQRTYGVIQDDGDTFTEDNN